MKNKDNNQIKILSEKIAALEKEIQLGNKEAELELTSLFLSFSLEEMLQVDEYITKNKLLT